MTDRATILASLTASLAEAEGNDSGDVTTEAGDLIAGVRDYIEATQRAITGVALAEVAFAFIAGAEYVKPDRGARIVATAALRKAGLSL